MKVVYIAGPFRGKTPWDVERNIRRAEELALKVALLGAMPLCPHTMTRFFDKQGTDAFWLEGTIELLRRADAAIFTSDWRRSSGSRGEREDAENHQQPIFDEDELYTRFAAWLEVRLCPVCNSVIQGLAIDGLCSDACVARWDPVNNCVR